MKKRQTRNILIVVLVAAIVVVHAGILILTVKAPDGKWWNELPFMSNENQEEKIQKIFFMKGDNLLMADWDGGFIRFIANASGNLDVSQDGTRLAAGCWDRTQICIYDTTQFPFSQIYPYEPSDKTPVFLPVDEACDQDTLQEIGIISMSWSRDGSKLAYVCLDHKSDNDLFCVHSFLDDETVCRSGHLGEDGLIINVEYSPIEDVLVGQTNNQQMLIFNELGHVITSLGKGIEPTWSPDGEKIAFIRDPELSLERPGNRGYAMVNKDGTGFEWILPDKFSEDEDALFATGCYDRSIFCGMSWSPDGRYLAFGAVVGVFSFYHILRYDFETETMINLTQQGFPGGYGYTLPVFAEIPVEK